MNAEMCPGLMMDKTRHISALFALGKELSSRRTLSRI